MIGVLKIKRNCSELFERSEEKRAIAKQCQRKFLHKGTRL